MIFFTDKKTFHATCHRIIRSMMLEKGGVKIGIQFTVDTMQIIKIKIAGKALGVIICLANNIRRFFKIKSNEYLIPFTGKLMNF